MSGQFMKYSYLAAIPLALAVIAVEGMGQTRHETKFDALRFFEGKTDSVATIKLMMKRPYKSRGIGNGEIQPDGSLLLVQRIEDEGKAPHDRRWHIREVAPGQFTGTMSEAKGPVTVDEVEGRYRFRFKMKGNVSVEQWITPLPGGKSAKSKVTIRKMGITVGQSEGTITKLSGK